MEQTAITLQDKLEQLVDEKGLGLVLEALGGICREKAEHLRSNWQDEDAASRWEAYAEILYVTETDLAGVQ